jgi:hypothetical protein
MVGKLPEMNGLLCNDRNSRMDPQVNSLADDMDTWKIAQMNVHFADEGKDRMETGSE